MYVCQYLISLTSFLPDIFIILYNPSRYFFGLPFFLNCHRALPPKFKRIPSCFSECFEKIPSLNLNSEFIDLCPDLALSSSFVRPGFGILTTLGSHYANYICKVLFICKIYRNINQELITLQSAVRRPEIYRLFRNGTNPHTYHT